MKFKLTLMAIAWVSLLISLTALIQAYLVSRKNLAEIEEHLQRSPMVIENIGLIGGGRLGALYRLLQIISALAMPGFFVRRGMLSPLDVEQFPLVLKRKLVVIGLVGFVSGCLGLGIAVFGKYSGLFLIKSVI